MSKINSLTRQAFASVLIFLLSACAEDPLGDNDQTGKGSHTVTLRLSATVVPIPETKATATSARSGSDAEAAGFYYEMVSSDAVTPGFSVEMESTTPESVVISLGTKAPTTKAPATLKNTYALLFTNSGAFNGRASIGAFTVGTPQDITFTKVVNPTATGCRLVIVANNHAAVTPYASDAGTGDFAGFTGTYAEFQKLTITSEVSKDEDVPYAGSATVNLSQNEIGATAEVPLSWTLAKITLNNHKFEITGGPARNSITLYNAGVRRFATPGNDNYNGTGTTQTIDVVASTAGSNTASVTWYVGENIQPAVAGIKTSADRNGKNAPTNACYIRVASAALAAVNKSPKIGEEYIESGTKSFTYDYYLGRSSDKTDFSLRRHTHYTINSEISGTLAGQEKLAVEDGRVTLSRPTPAGLVIGRFGGPTGYTTGTGAANAIKGTYEKLLLLEPNTSRTTAIDKITKVWGVNGINHQTETRKYWDWTYIYGIKTGGTVGGMDTAPGSLYDYCYRLTLGGVPEGTWYVPTQVQMRMIWAVYGGLKVGNYGDYTGFGADSYLWSSVETGEALARYMYFRDGGAQKNGISKATAYGVRCVRDLSASNLSGQNVITNHPSANGYPVFDLTELSPLGSVLTTTEAIARRTEMNKQTPSNSVVMDVGSNVSAANGTWNSRMSPLFQIMRADHTVGLTDWANAYESCKEYDGEEQGAKEAGQWRLPTQRELMLIWALHPQLLEKGGFTALIANNYWSSTEYDKSQAWFNAFYDGYVSCTYKTQLSRVRCVKDLL